ncbi:Putative calmodulin-like protein [Seminavis robusta]|uniref:Calmodulin-like protein n=1 Tax=Seminavis robusta TaxID=568900 RepID=A0A9N8EMT1_9STRA|nr:Putative calmodulin-like protein [Seminavis robusta]|eukprot:Sro1247_g255910.1 Putative calmodulin-like protein (600) ;mRNA; f:24768-26774
MLMKPSFFWYFLTTILLILLPEKSGALPISLVTSNTAVEIVQNIASAVAAPPKRNGKRVRSRRRFDDDDIFRVEGIGGSVMTNGKEEAALSGALEPVGQANLLAPLQEDDDNPKEQVWTALSRLESNMEMLDELAGQKSQLNTLEATILAGCIAAAASGPLIGGSLTEFVAPSAAALCAAIGVGAEYVGKTAVADGKELAAISLQCAAEAEAILAQAERSKAITPLCVGIGATSATCSLVIPAVLEASGLLYSAPGVRELYLLCPVAAVLSAAIGGLASQEVRQFSRAAIGVGNRRFARSGSVGRTWLSAGQQIARKSETGRKKLTTFTLSVIPAPLVGVLMPGSLATKTIIVCAFAAAESAYFLAETEYTLSRATDAVALKSRSAAVCDTYANQATRSAAILPFTSALSALCAATTAAIVELPFFEASTSALITAGQVVGISFFPTCAALLAGAASVSKARCEVDTEAAMEAASTLALEYEENSKLSPVLKPIQATSELISLTLGNSMGKPVRRFWRRLGLILRIPRRWFFRSSLRRAFRIFDSDRDGLLSVSEIRRCVNKLGVSLSEDEVSDMVRDYDQDGDNKINYDEFVKMMMSR